MSIKRELRSKPSRNSSTASVCMDVFITRSNHESSTRRTCPAISSADEFRSIVLENLEKAGSHVVVNYHFAAFYPWVYMGHFSPLGGYHFREDKFLLLDVWPNNPIGWVKTEKLFDAMIPEDSSSHLPRGFALLMLTEFATRNFF